MEETYPNPIIEKALQENYNMLEGLPLDTPLFHENHYFGTIPPTLVEWISEPVFASIHAKRYGRYRIFKNTYGTYTLQDIGSCDSVNIVTGDLDYIIKAHKEWSDEMPVFVQNQVPSRL